jgi:ADP-ribose pyrophosphatase
VKRLDSEHRLSAHAFDVVRGRYRRVDGSEVERDVVVHPGSVAIVAHDERFVYLVEQPREAVEEDALLELPAGTLDPEDESALDCAKRELREETGLEAEEWEELCSIYPTPGYSSEAQPLFRATGLSEHEANPDDDEQIEVVRWPLDELDRAVAELRDATTLVGLMLLQRQLERPSQ